MTSLTIKESKSLFMRAKNAYFNSSEPLMTDLEFDRLEARIKKIDPKWKGFTTGAKVDGDMKKMEVKLPFPAPSLDKAYPPTFAKVAKYIKTDKAIVSPKLDGVSLELIYKNGTPVQLCTRGDGTTGGDISYLIPYLNIPRNVGAHDLYLRCEGVLTKNRFKQFKAAQKKLGEKIPSSARSAVSGMCNRSLHKARESMIDIMDVVVVGVSFPKSKAGTWSQYLDALDAFDFNTVTRILLPKKSLTVERCIESVNRAKALKYECDGIVICSDSLSTNKYGVDNPDWAIAFKTDDLDGARQTTVLDVEWRPSSASKLAPRLRLDEVDFDGVKVNYASAKSAVWLKDNAVGIGAVVKVIRAGDIIPELVEVVKPAKFTFPDFPKAYWEWDRNGTHIILTQDGKNALGGQVDVKVASRFFSKLEIQGLKEATLKKLASVGLTSIKQIVQASPKKFVTAGLGEKQSLILHDNIQTALFDKGVTEDVLAGATPFFDGQIGSTRIKAVLDDLGGTSKPLDGLSPHDICEALNGMSGMKELLKVFADNWPTYTKWRDTLKIKIIQPKRHKTLSKKYVGRSVTFTGYRDAGQEQEITANGGQVVSFGSKTTHLLVTQGGKASTKADKAKAKGIWVGSFSAFEEI